MSDDEALKLAREALDMAKAARDSARRATLVANVASQVTTANRITALHALAGIVPLPDDIPALVDAFAPPNLGTADRQVIIALLIDDCAEARKLNIREHERLNKVGLGGTKPN